MSALIECMPCTIFGESESGGRTVPTFYRFDGFRVEIRSRDHSPPHFHIIGPDFHALIDIRTLQVIRGSYTRRALADVVDWASGQTEALMTEWRRLNERG